MGQDDQCFACGRRFRRNHFGQYSGRFVAITIDGQRPFIGRECYRRVVESGADGYQPARGGPRLWDQYQAPPEALQAAGITITYQE